MKSHALFIIAGSLTTSQPSPAHRAPRSPLERIGRLGDGMMPHYIVDTKERNGQAVVPPEFSRGLDRSGIDEKRFHLIEADTFRGALAEALKRNA